MEKQINIFEQDIPATPSVDKPIKVKTTDDKVKITDEFAIIVPIKKSDAVHGGRCNMSKIRHLIEDVYGIRADDVEMTYKVLDYADICDPNTGKIIYSFTGNDMAALRVSCRLRDKAVKKNE